MSQVFGKGPARLYVGIGHLDGLVGVLCALVGGELLLREKEEVVLELCSQTDKLLNLRSRFVDFTSHRFQFGIGAEKTIQMKNNVGVPLRLYLYGRALRSVIIVSL